jgi:outer membrane lipoprotein-sorting protein
MYRLALLVFLFIGSAFTSVVAQPAGFSAVKDLAAFKTRFSTESSKVLSITSDFKQEKELIALTEKITSTGKFWFKRTNKVRIDYQKPFVYRLIMNGEKILIKDDQQENRVNVKSNKLFQQVNKIMLDCIQGTILSSKDFSSIVYENDKSYLLAMTPNSKALKEFFETIYLSVDKKDYSVNSIEMKEPGGDRTVLTFTNKSLNQPVNEDIFAL